MHENREISSAPSTVGEGRSVKAIGRTADMHALEKSDCAIVPMNRPNNAAQAAAEAGEGTAQMKENIDQSHMLPTQSGNRMSQRLDGVRKAARERKQERFTSLLHHLTIALLRDSFYALKRGASPGVDGVRWQEYESGLAQPSMFARAWAAIPDWIHQVIITLLFIFVSTLVIRLVRRIWLAIRASKRLKARTAIDLRSAIKSSAPRACQAVF